MGPDLYAVCGTDYALSLDVKDTDAVAEHRAAQLADAGVDVFNLHHREWTAALTALFHSYSLLAFGWDAQHDRILDSMLGIAPP